MFQDFGQSNVGVLFYERRFTHYSPNWLESV